MIKRRQSVIGFNFEFKSKQTNYIDYRRSSTKKLKYPLSRTKSTKVALFQKKKFKKDQKENEKISKEVSSKINFKISYKPSDLNQIMKNISTKTIKSPKLLLKRNSFFKKVISDKHFYLIRKQINQKLKNTYKSPFMDYLIQKGYYIHHKKSDYPKYYNYYMICYLMNNKRCQLTLRYYDHLLFYNNQEYLIRYFGKSDYYIIINYLLFFVYNKDIESISKIKKKIVSFKEIKIMFNDLISNNSNFAESMEIFNEIVEHYRYSGINISNLSKMIVNLENVKPVFDEKIKYLYAKDVPPLSFPNSYPNFFPLIGVIFQYIKNYLKMRKLLKVKTDTDEHDNSKKDIILIEPVEKDEQKGKSYYEHKMQNKNKNKLSENNFLMNFSLSFSKSNYIENEASESIENKNQHNSNRRLKIDNDIYDVETLFEKILFEFGYNLKNKNAQKEEKPKNKSMERLFLKKGIKRVKSVRNINVAKILSESSIKFKNILKNPTKFRNQVDVFKTSVAKEKAEGALITDKINKNNIQASTRNNRKSLTKRIEFISPIYRNSSQNTSDKIFKYSLNSLSLSEKGKGNKIGFHQKIVSFNEYNREEDNKSNKNSQIIGLMSSFKNNKFKLKRNNSLYSKGKAYNSTIKDTSSYNGSSNTLVLSKFKDTQNFIANSAKNKYAINRYLSLKEINDISKKYKNIHKKIKYYKGYRQKSFASYSCASFDNKEVNVWENNKVDVDVTNNILRTNSLLNKIKNIDNQNKRCIKNSNTLNEIIKCPNIYI